MHTSHPPHETRREGSLTFFTGPMYARKTAALAIQLGLYALQDVPVVCVRPKTDTRSFAKTADPDESKHDKIESRTGVTLAASLVDPHDHAAFLKAVEGKRVVGVDEIQLFSAEIVSLLKILVHQGVTVLVAGLDTDFRGIPFPTCAALLTLPETQVRRECAVCSVCKRHNATRTQRLRHGKPVPANDPVILIEGDEAAVTYEPRCFWDHQI